ncbi:alpha/beta-hydrolase [Saitoella complicata NRRL Y-17804]|uniref:alpha/beta-hydrolase n=1 Tax=Saitoella complicata (strain BCRC 22490 / CBS 7301 / JCM 7358 / NBRC 10748 / NRRL Y-17804) TaxID=698492 RepID=UPI00086687C4|nr:alpha/beta-hydrolase [Saitoella complicata NRRL Y-17804]ODQ54537.1 alpha/beta-hydrolase [Saitoella complicata NRRL Y-17804]
MSLPSLLQPPLKSTLSDPLPTECHFYPSLPADEPPEALIYFIPGNPGFVSYYTDFFDEAWERMGKRVAILGVSHAGFPPALPLGEPLDVRGQVAHKVRILDRVLEEMDMKNKGGKRTKIVLVGHSVGSFIACEVLKERPDIVDAAILLFPTLSHIALSPQGKILTRCLSIPGFARGISYLPAILRTLLPSPILNTLVKSVTGLPEAGLRTTVDELLNSSSVYSALSLAASELLLIRDLDPNFFATHASKLICYYAATDAWVAEWAREEVRSMGEEKGLKFYLCAEGVPHAFCLRHGRLMGEKVAGWVQELIRADELKN